MRTIIMVILIGSLLAGCASAPTPKQPRDFNRVPVNKTIPAEIQAGVL